MSAPLTTSPPAATTPFRDGLGDRLSYTDKNGRRLEVLRLRPELLQCVGFAVALRERVAALASFEDPSFARVYRVDAVPSAPPTLAVLSDRPDGTRLSDLLERAASGSLDTTPRVVVAVLRQLVPALTRLSRHAPGLAHGGVAPEHVFVGPDGALRVTDSAFGGALERLNLPRRDLWRTFRIATPSAAGSARCDERGDVTQLGVLALALLLGRTLGVDEYPDRVAALAREATEVWIARGRPTPPPVVDWIARALQIDPRRSFATMADAHSSLTRTPVWQIDEASARCVLGAWAAGETVARQARRTQRIHLAAANDAAPAPPPSSPALGERPAVVASGPGRAAGVRPSSSRPAPRATAAPARPSAPPAKPRTRGWRWVLVAALALVSIGSVTIAGTRGYLRWTSAARLGTLSLESSPAGVDVFVDGLPRGATPARLALAPGAHIVELRGRGVPKVLPIKIAAGETVTRLVRFRDAASGSAAPGQLAVRSAPEGARVSIDGEPRGVAPITILGLAPGEHDVAVEQDGRAESRRVTVTSGVTTVIEVPVAPPVEVTTGWLEVDAPFDMELSEGGRALGAVRTGRLSLSAGRHEIQIANATLGFYATRTVEVRPGEPTPLVVQLPFGMVQVNAQPWAEVWMDGRKVGDTPIGDLSVPIGPHEFLFRHPQLGERRYAVSVTAAEPVHLTVDMRQQP